jgi:hypothetical protein
MLIVSALVSSLLGEQQAAIAIIVIVLANAILGVVQVCQRHAVSFVYGVVSLMY